MKFDCIIWSKNRPAQLDCLLRSIKKYFNDVGNIFIIYTSTTSEFNSGYNKCVLKEYGLNTNFIGEKDFNSDFKDILNNKIMTKYFLGISDDNVFIHNTNLPATFELQENEIAFSLRLSNNATFCQPRNLDQKVPIFEYKENNIIKWNWVNEGQMSDYGYPLPIDSNIYRTDFIRNCLNNVQFNTPAEAEVYLDHHCKDYSKPFMRSFTDCKLVSICANSVYQGYQNINMGISLEELNNKWLSGLQIKLPEVNPNACHIFYTYNFEGEE
jgi:hypothetical protein